MLSLLQKAGIGLALAALAFGQTSATSQFTAAYQALTKRDYDSAILCFRSGLKQQPGNLQARKDLAYTLVKTGESAAARDEFQAVLDLDKSDEQAALEYAFLASETGEPQEARRSFETLSQSASGATRKTAQKALLNLAKQGAAEIPQRAAEGGDVLDSAPVRGGNLWVFFDSSYRMRADVDYLAKRWSEEGISMLFVATWHNMEGDSGADEYLKRLIAACHAHAIVVYAWLELPYVSEKFWADYPEWREKNGLGRDAVDGWRKPMNLQNPECNRAAEKLVGDSLKRFDWDGVNLAELSFDQAGDSFEPARFTPLNENVRSEFKDLADFDPLMLFDPASPHANRKDREAFLKFRKVVQDRLEQEWLRYLTAIQKSKPYLDVVRTLKDEHGNFSIKTTAKQKIAIDLNAVGTDRSKLCEQIASAAKQRLAVALYGENTLSRADFQAIGKALAGPETVEREMPPHVTGFNGEIQSATASKTEVDLAYQSRARAAVTFDKKVAAIEVDGAPFWKEAESSTAGSAMLPAGQHLVSFLTR